MASLASSSEAGSESPCGGVGIHREEGHPPELHIGGVYSGIGAHVAVARLRDEHFPGAPQDASRLGHGDCNAVVRANHTAFGLGHRLLSDHDHVVVLDLPPRRGCYECGEVHPGGNFGDPLERENP